MDATLMEAFDPKTPVYSMLDPGRVGKVASSWIDVLTRKAYVVVEWNDGVRELVLGDWIREEALVTPFSADPKDLNKGKKKGSVEMPDVREVVAKFRPVSMMEMDGIILPLGSRIALETGALSPTVDQFIQNAKLSYSPDGSVIAAFDNMMVKATISKDSSDVEDIVFIKNSSVVRPAEFFAGMSMATEIVIASVGESTYSVKIGGEEFQMTRDQLEGFTEDYVIPIQDVDKACDDGESYTTQM